MESYANPSVGPSQNLGKSLHERLHSKDDNIIADSDPDMEVRQVKTYANHSMGPSPNHEKSLHERSHLKDDNIIADDDDADMEDAVHLPRQSKSRPVSKKSSPVRVYSYKVNHLLASSDDNIIADDNIKNVLMFGTSRFLNLIYFKWHKYWGLRMK